MATQPLSGDAAHGAAFTSDTSPLTCTQAQPTHARLVTSRREHLVSCPHTHAARHIHYADCLRYCVVFAGLEPLTRAHDGSRGLQGCCFSRWNFVIFCQKPPGASLALFSSHSRPPPAGGLNVHRHTCWVRVGGQITG